LQRFRLDFPVKKGRFWSSTPSRGTTGGLRGPSGTAVDSGGSSVWGFSGPREQPQWCLFRTRGE